MIPADLLNQLREADEELFLKVIGGFPLKNGKYLSILGMKPSATHAWLQHCLQEAIRARVGWGYQITAFGLPIIACVYNRRDYITARGESEAEALGWAYLAVIEAIRP